MSPTSNLIRDSVARGKYCLLVFAFHFFFLLGESEMIPEDHSTAIIDHVCMVHSSVDHYSKLFLQKLRRCNYVTPKNYLDFINTYSSLLEDKDEFILGMT